MEKSNVSILQAKLTTVPGVRAKLSDLTGLTRIQTGARSWWTFVSAALASGHLSEGFMTKNDFAMNPPDNVVLRLTRALTVINFDNCPGDTF